MKNKAERPGFRLLQSFRKEKAVETDKQMNSKYVLDTCGRRDKKPQKGPYSSGLCCSVKIKFGMLSWISFLVLCLTYIAKNRQGKNHPKSQ